MMMMHMIMQSVGDLQSFKINLHIIAYASIEQLICKKNYTRFGALCSIGVSVGVDVHLCVFFFSTILFSYL